MICCDAWGLEGVFTLAPDSKGGISTRRGGDGVVTYGSWLKSLPPQNLTLLQFNESETGAR
jgi:hypothetical protein